MKRNGTKIQGREAKPVKTAEERQKDIEDAKKALRNVIALRKEKVLYLYRAHVHTRIREGPAGRCRLAF